MGVDSTNSRVGAVLEMVVGTIVEEVRLHPTNMLVRSMQLKRNLGFIISSLEVYFKVVVLSNTAGAYK
jgi:hypothetical protein